MVLGKIKNYAIATLLVASLAGGVTCYFLNKSNIRLSDQLKAANARIEKAESNLELVTEQLDAETKNRIAAEKALSELDGVSEEIYNEELDPALGAIIDSFHDRLR